MNNNALFPISLGNKLFSSRRIVEPLKIIAKHYQNIYFLLPDGLSLYNQARKSIENNSLQRTISEIKTANIHNYKTWINKLILRLQQDHENINCELLILSDTIDSEYFDCYRKIQIFYTVSETFAKDISNAAKQYLTRSKLENNHTNRNLCILFLLEELAASIMIKCKYKITDEFYLGRSLAPFINFFNDVYEIGLKDVVPEAMPVSFNYYYFNFDKNTWVNEKEEAYV